MPIICHSDGQLGLLQYRGIPIERLFRDHVYEDVMHLIMSGHIPTQQEKESFRTLFSNAAIPSQTVKDVISAFP